jgi:hypothetical protein
MASSTNPSRYALYVAPPPESELWRFGCDVIGRDALTGAFCVGFAPQGYPPDSWAGMTSEPRRYGFHATLKAPFRLRADLSAADLIGRIAELARKFAPFDAGELSVGAIAASEGRGFVALQPEGDLRALRAFEGSVVRALDPLRAPLTESERQRRRPERLTRRQAYYLDAWGYPYVLDEFRPHFTLTNAIPDADRVARALGWEFRLRVASPALRIDALTLFAERESGGEFKILRRFPLGRSELTRRPSSRILAPAFLD